MSIMARKSERKLFLFGRYSLALLPPKRWLSELGVKAGDIVHLELDRARKRIVVRLNVRSTPTTTKKPTTKGKRPTKSDSDWEPIPQL